MVWEIIIGDMRVTRIRQVSLSRTIPRLLHLYSNSTIDHADTWCQNDVVSTSMRRHHVASTLIRHHVSAGNCVPLHRIYLLKSHGETGREEICAISMAISFHSIVMRSTTLPALWFDPRPSRMRNSQVLSKLLSVSHL